MSSTASVYTGFWINWSYGRVYGSTITLSGQNSALLIAFIALFVRFSGGQLWAVLTFLISFTRSSAKPRDALYHQQQAVHRNTSQPESFLWANLKLLWFWRGTAPRVKRRTFTWVLSALAYMAAFVVAGIFSSRISSTNSEVLLLPSEFCGTWSFPYLRLFDSTKESWQDYSTQRTRYSANADQLFDSSHKHLLECSNVTRQNSENTCSPKGRSTISWSTHNNITCPFDDDICIADAIQFDSGFIDSRAHLGINAEADRVEYRRLMTCAPITTVGYTSDFVNGTVLNATGINGFSAVEGETFQRYMYGSSTLFNDDNTTFAFNNYTWTSSDGFAVDEPFYKLDAEFSAAAPNDPDSLMGSSFTAIPSLSRSDADTTLVFLMSSVLYLTEVRDPWFQATTESSSAQLSADDTIRSIDFYNPDAFVTVVACAEQHQLRNPTNGATSRLGAEEVVTITQARQLNFTDNQLAIFNRSFFIGTYNILDSIVPHLGGPNLLATAGSFLGISPGIPDYQWQLEFEHWFGVGLNSIQLWSQQYVTGPSQSEMHQYVVPAIENGDFAQQMCTNQITRRADYRSFSVLGMSLVFALGLLFALANVTLGPILQRVQQHTVKGRYRNAEWQANEMLQLQRMAYQHDDIGTWKGQDDLVPTTARGEVFTLPESTGWNQDIPPKRSKSDEKRLFRLWSRTSSTLTKDVDPLVTSMSGSNAVDETHRVY